MPCERGLVGGSVPDEVAAQNRFLPVHSDGSQHLLVGGFEGDEAFGPVADANGVNAQAEALFVAGVDCQAIK